MTFPARFAFLIPLLLTGCTTVSDSQVTRESVYDEDLMARVERAAERAGAKVYWINPPYKRTAAAPN